MTFIEKAIVEHLLSIAEISDIIGANVENVFSGQASQGPRIVVQKISGPRYHSLGGASGLANPRIQITCWGSTFTAAKNLARLVRLNLDTFRGQMGETDGGVNVQSCLIEDERDDIAINPGLDQTSNRFTQLDFILMHDEELPYAQTTLELQELE